ncbi:MAG TPA: glycoside hydrolase family 15 protein [Pseudonocardiaceae bacterium]|jgi:glucoamylase|nr:glycoside hydrolase family 15 protein [Pseudonocardiaceae bacterium]
MSTAQPVGPGNIEDYALLSDLRTAALVGIDGSIDWLCLPRFDSSSCFARLLGDEQHGHWRIAPTDEVLETRRAYRDTTMVLETEFVTADGVIRLIDFMPPQQHRDRDRKDQPRIVRIVEGVSGSVEVSLRWVVRFAYAASVPWVRRMRKHDNEYLLALAGPRAVTLRGDRLPFRVPHKRAHEASFTVMAGERLSWVMEYLPDADEQPQPIDVDIDLRYTEALWHEWADQISYDGPHTEAVHRSLTTLKALTYAPTGGIVAAPTTSLPEAPGGERNWDYRYCWLRDATLTLLAFDNFGCSQEAAAWRTWLTRAVAGDPADLQIMYGIDGERHLIEWEADWLPGYSDARPVRIGNAAYRQLQLDVYGEVMDALHLARERGHTETPDSWSMQRGLMGHLEKIWQQPDNGLWEVRGEGRHFTHSRVMVWVAFDRAVRAVEEDGLPGPVERWREIRDQVHKEVLANAFNAEIGAFTQYYGGTALDAATLLIPAVGFLPGTDERVCATIDAIGKHLKHGDLIDRYTTESGQSEVDGLKGHEGSFLVCSFWYVDALALAGRQEEAEAMFERLLGLCNDVGLLAEEYDPVSRRFLGNFPQAFSHLGLVNSAAVLYREQAKHHRHEANRRNGAHRKAD